MPPALATGTFEARGPAIDAEVITEFTCGDGPLAGDTFVVQAQLHVGMSAGSPTWVVKGGTGAFADLHGNGGGSGSLIFGLGGPVDAADFYLGSLH